MQWSGESRSKSSSKERKVGRHKAAWLNMFFNTPTCQNPRIVFAGCIDYGNVKYLDNKDALCCLNSSLNDIYKARQFFFIYLSFHTAALSHEYYVQSVFLSRMHRISGWVRLKLCTVLYKVKYGNDSLPKGMFLSWKEDFHTKGTFYHVTIHLTASNVILYIRQ